MSDKSGGQLHSRERRRSERPRKRNRHPAKTDGPPAPPPPRDHREPRRPQDRDRQRPPREEHPAPPAATSTLTLGQKLLRIFTFGLVRPKSKSAPHPEHRDRSQKQTPPVPPSDPDAVTSPRLHVGNLHYDISEDDLLDLFKGVGPVKSVDIVYDGLTHRSRGRGFVEFTSLADARRAVAELHGLPYLRRPLILGPARSRGHDEREADVP